MRKRTLVRQLLLFTVTGFIVASLYDSVVLEVNDTEPETTTKGTTKLIPTVPPRRRKLLVDCKKIIESNKQEIELAKAYMKVHRPRRITPQEYINITRDCDNFRKILRYDTYPIKEEEREFPIAFSIITFKDADQTERLLRAIYRPQNFYCIHVDASSPPELHSAMRSISDCFTNVFIVSKTEDIVYNDISRLRADINCMADLHSLSTKWKYFINLPHQQYPLKTNLEMVKILKIYNGANDIEGISKKGRMMDSRFKYSFKLVNGAFQKTKEKNQTLPYGAKIVKGSAYGVFSRDFVHYILNDDRAKAILKYMEDVKSPDEYYWATLNHNDVLEAPGRYSGKPDDKPWLAVYASWGGQDRCHGKFVRGVCVFGVGDLNELISKKELFANKFYADYHYYALDCMEEYLYNRTFIDQPFETFYYKQLPFIKKTS